MKINDVVPVKVVFVASKTGFGNVVGEGEMNG